MSATHHCGHQKVAENHLMSVKTLHLKSSMAFFQVVHLNDFVDKIEVAPKLVISNDHYSVGMA